MSHALQTLDGRPLRYKNSRHKEIRQPKLRSDDLTHRRNEIALDMVSDSVVFFTALTSRLVDMNRAACQSLGYSQRQLRRMSLLDIAPDAKSGVLAQSIRRVT